MPALSSIDSLNLTAFGSLIFVCPDQSGVISNLTHFFAERDISISKYVDFTDDETVFSRLEWPLNDRWEDEAEFEIEFAQLAEEYGAIFETRFSNHKQSVGLLVGSESHALLEFVNRYSPGFGANLNIPFVIGSDERVRSIADRYGLPFFYIEVDQSSAESVMSYEKRQLDIINRYKPDCLGFASYETLISPEFIDATNCPIVKVTRTFMPTFEGLNAFQMAYKQGVKLVGATAYFVSKKSNYGPIIEQDMRKLKDDLTYQGLIKKSSEVEQAVFVEAMTKVLEHKVIIHKKRTICFN